MSVANRSRRERALARMKSDKYYGITPGFERQIMDVIDCYEVELAADLGASVDLFCAASWGPRIWAVCDPQPKRTTRRRVREAIKTLLEVSP